MSAYHLDLMLFVGLMKAPFLFPAAAKPTRPKRPGKPAGVCLPKEQKYYVYFDILLTFRLLFSFLLVLLVSNKA